MGVSGLHHHPPATACALASCPRLMRLQVVQAYFYLRRAHKSRAPAMLIAATRATLAQWLTPAPVDRTFALVRTAELQFRNGRKPKRRQPLALTVSVDIATASLAQCSRRNARQPHRFLFSGIFDVQPLPRSECLLAFRPFL